MIEKKCLEHHSMLSALREPSNGATALKHLKQQVCESYPSYCAIFSIYTVLFGVQGSTSIHRVCLFLARFFIGFKLLFI